jgi:hypothetical protein
MLSFLLIYDLMVSYEHAFAAPTEGSVSVSPLEFLIGEMCKLIYIDITDQL